MIESSSSPRVGVSTALQASPARSTRSNREDHVSLSEGLLPIRTSPGPATAQSAVSRGPSRAKWIILRMCLVLFAVASCMVLVADARQSNWVSNLMKKGDSQAPQAPTSAFQVGPCSLQANMPASHQVRIACCMHLDIQVSPVYAPCRANGHSL